MSFAILNEKGGRLYLCSERVAPGEYIQYWGNYSDPYVVFTTDPDDAISMAIRCGGVVTRIV